MFGGRFGHTRFGLRDKFETETSVSAMFIERVRSLVSVGGNVLIDNEFRERAVGESILTRGIEIVHNFKDGISASVDLVKDYYFDAEFNENIKSNLWLAEDIYAEHILNESLKSSAFLGKNVPAVHDFGEVVIGRIFICKNTPIIHELREAVFTYTEATVLEVVSFIISETLNPGEELLYLSIPKPASDYKIKTSQM